MSIEPTVFTRDWEGSWHLAPDVYLWPIHRGAISMLHRAGIHVRPNTDTDIVFRGSYLTVPWAAMVIQSCQGHKPAINRERIVACLSEAQVDLDYRSALESCWHANGATGVSQMVESTRSRLDRISQRHHEAKIRAAERRIQRYKKEIASAKMALERWETRLRGLTSYARSGECNHDQDVTNGEA